MAELRHRAADLLERWYHAREEAIVKPAHPLVTVQEMHLVDGEGRTVRGTTKRSGRSSPPIRDLPWEFRRITPIMKLIGETNQHWLRAMELFAEHGSIKRAGEVTGKHPKQLMLDFKQGLAILQAEMVRLGI